MKNKTCSSYLVLLLTALILSIPRPGYSSDSSKADGLSMEAEKQAAMAAIQEFAGKLKAELKQALKEGGAVYAISVCSTRAQEIGREVSEKRNLNVGRVSLKNRNPANAPSDWQKEVLEKFERRKNDGEPVAELTFAEVAEIEENRQFRFMKAIPTGAICIKCHGQEISTEVKNRLDELYPGDRARGFRPGDIRGAFVVTRDVGH